MSCTVGFTMFVGEHCDVGVVRSKDVDIDEAREVTVWGFASLVWTDIVFVIALSGWTRVHAASDENGV